MNRRSGSVVGAIATLGMAVCGAIALLSGVLTLVTIPGGMSVGLASIFAIFTGAAAVFSLLYLSDHIRNG